MFLFLKETKNQVTPNTNHLFPTKAFSAILDPGKIHLEVPEYRFGFNQISIYDQAFKIHNPDLLSFQIQIKWGGGSSMKPNISREVTLIPV